MDKDMREDMVGNGDLDRVALKMYEDVREKGIVLADDRRDRWPTPEEFCFDWYNLTRAEQLEKADQIVMALSHFANCPRTWDRTS